MEQRATFAPGNPFGVKRLPEAEGSATAERDAVVLRFAAEAIQAIEALDDWIGGDPYLDLMRARAYAESGDLKTATSFAEKATQREPGLTVAWWRLVAFTLEQNDYKALSATLSAMEEKQHQPVDDLLKDPAFADFLKSNEYRRWTTSRKK